MKAEWEQKPPVPAESDCNLPERIGISSGFFTSASAEIFYSFFGSVQIV